VQEKAWSPGDFVKASKVSPNKKPTIVSPILGSLKGNHNKKRKYKYGEMNRCNGGI
jgi:hypothetical protein